MNGGGAPVDTIRLPGALRALAETKLLIGDSVGSLSADDTGYFGPGSISWRVFSHASYGASGIAAVLAQALNPVAMAIVDARSAFRVDAWARAHLTAKFVFAVTFSSRTVADAAAARVRRIHGAIEGVDPASGLIRRADDPELLLWVHAIHTDYALRGYEALAHPLTAEEADRFVKEQTIAARLVGLDPATTPASVAELRGWIAAAPTTLTDPARSFASMLMQARMPLSMRPFWAMHMAAAATLLPAALREGYGMAHWLPSGPSRAALRAAFRAMNKGYLLFAPVRAARARMRAFDGIADDSPRSLPA